MEETKILEALRALKVIALSAYWDTHNDCNSYSVCRASANLDDIFSTWFPPKPCLNQPPANQAYKVA